MTNTMNEKTELEYLANKFLNSSRNLQTPYMGQKTNRPRQKNSWNTSKNHNHPKEDVFKPNHSFEIVHWLNRLRKSKKLTTRKYKRLTIAII